MKINTEDCEKCNGKGYLLSRKKVLRRCPKCLGCGGLDWLENVVGPNRERRFPSDSQLLDRYYETNTITLYDWKKTKWK